MNKRSKLIGSLIICSIFIIFTIIGIINQNRDSDNNNEDIFVESKSLVTEAKESDQISEAKDKIIKVEVKGEVAKPGVYTMTYGSRLEDLIAEAGGLTDNADRNSLPSLAKKLKDEDCVVVRNISEVKDKRSELSPEAAAAMSIISSGDEEELININTADFEKLQEIPGVGPVTAQKIIDYREKYGDFSKIEDLKNIDRIGDKTVEKIKEKITVE